MKLELYLKAIWRRLCGESLRLAAAIPKKVPTDAPFETILKGYRAAFIKHYFFPFLNNLLRYDEVVYDYICNNFTDKASSDMLNFDGILIPKVGYELAGLFSLEARDIIYPEIVDYELCKTIFNEGPYEFGDVCMSHGDTVIDCGANMGFFSAVASHKIAVTGADGGG